jgi:hypothetical protein
MSKFEKSMSEIFDVVPKVTEQTEQLPVVVEASTEFGSPARLEVDLDADYEESRKTLKELVKKGSDAIDHLLSIATETEHPRAFEVVATLIKNTTDANEKLLMMQKSMREMKGMSAKRDSGNVTVDKAIFVGSTSELSKLLKDSKKNGDTEH